MNRRVLVSLIQAAMLVTLIAIPLGVAAGEWGEGEPQVEVVREAQGDISGAVTHEDEYPNTPIPDLQFGSYGTGPGNLISPRGTAVDGDHNVYITDCANHNVQVFSPTGQFLHGFGGYGSSPGEFICPTGIALSTEGTILVADLGNSRVQELLTDGTPVRSFGQYGTDHASLNRPHGIAVTDERIVVVSTATSRVVVFDRQGTYLFSFGGPGDQTGEFARPTGVAVGEDGDIYVADSDNNRIQRFSSVGEFRDAWGKIGSFPGDLAGPWGIAASPDGHVFVSDAVNHRIQVFGESGDYLFQFGRHPAYPHQGNGRLHYPMPLGLSPDGEFVVVCEKFESRCQGFNVDKAQQDYVEVADSAWWQKYPFFHYRSPVITRDPPDGFEMAGVEGGDQLLLTAEEELHRVLVLAFDPDDATTLRVVLSIGQTPGSRPGQLRQPQAVEIDSEGQIWVADTMNHRLQVFDVNGRLLHVVGGPGSRPGEFLEPGAMWATPDGTLYVTDAGNNRIQVLDIKTRQVLTTWGGTGEADGQFLHPIYIAMNPEEDRVYVLDITPRVQVFDRRGQFQLKWGTLGIGPGEFRSPLKIGVGPDGSVYLSDESLNRINKFDADGNFILSWGRHGTGPGEFYLPQGVAVDRKGRVWVIDYGNHRGQTFTSSGEYLFTWGEDVILNADLDGGPRLPGYVFAGVGALVMGGLILSSRVVRRWANNHNGDASNLEDR